MRSYRKEFCKRGLMWGAWGGPMVLAAVWMWLEMTGEITALTAREAATGIFTTALLGFVAAGISIVHQIESIPKVTASLLQFFVLYVDYLGIYLINGWITPNQVWGFTMIFATIFAGIWLTVYITTKRRVKKINQILET